MVSHLLFEFESACQLCVMLPGPIFCSLLPLDLVCVLWDGCCLDLTTNSLTSMCVKSHKSRGPLFPPANLRGKARVEFTPLVRPSQHLQACCSQPLELRRVGWECSCWLSPSGEPMLLLGSLAPQCQHPRTKASPHFYLSPSFVIKW